MSGLVLPFVLISGAAAALPFLFARLLPEGVVWLIVNGILSAMALTLVSSGYFLWAYGRADTRVLDLLGFAPGETVGYFLRLGLSAGLIWGPVMVLALSAQPKRWKEVQW